jgi:hypothetical protein
LVVGGIETVTAPAIGELQAVRLETFALDDPGLPADQRMEWLGRFYARGIGLIAEGDGLGAECVLEKYHLEN